MMQSKHSVLTRLLSIWVLLAMVLSILPGGVLAADIWSDWQKEHIKPVNALGTNAEYHPAVTAAEGSFSVKAKVVNHVASLEVTTNSGLDGSGLYAVVFHYAGFSDSKLSEFVTKLNQNTITAANAQGLTPTDYRYCVTKPFAASGNSVTITGNDWTAATGSSKTLKPITVNNTNSTSITTDGDKGTEFYRTYAFVVMSVNVGGKTADSYAYGTFIMDAEGNMLEDTYMIRYIKNQNNPANVGIKKENNKDVIVSTVSGTVVNQIVPWSNTTNLRSEAYTRPGYEFKGWDTDANRANSWLKHSTVSAPLFPGYHDKLWKTWAEIQTAGQDAVDYQPGAAFDPNNPAGRGKEYGITNLYAVWYPKSVEFKDDGLPTSTVTANNYTFADVSVQEITPEMQVRKAFTYKNALDGTTATDTEKEVVQFISTGSVKIGSETVTLSNMTTYGLSVSADGTTGWKLTGTPTQYSETPLYFLIVVTDKSNNTKDLLLLKVPRIKKAAQPVPTMDENTGLQSRVEPVTPETGEAYDDGQIFGFYSAGPKIGDDTGYLAISTDKTKGTYGTGTMTGYYENLGMVYEYRPKTIGGTDVDWTAEGYKDMPAVDGEIGWREVPFISGRYNAADLPKITAAGEKNAKTLMYSTLANGNAGTKAVVADKTNDATVNASAEFKATGWLDSYGWITFNDAGLPEIHGLTEDDVYEVRFRENANAAESDPQLIQIGGAAAAAPGGGSGLLFNLMKGSVWAVTPGQEPPQETAVREVELTIGEHGTVTVENLTPAPAGEATQAEDEEEPVQPSYTNGTFKFTVTDPDKACTVTVVAEAGYTASAVIGGEAGEFTDSTLTLPKTSADGKLAVAVRFEPAAGGGEETEATLLAAQGGTERDVTAQLFGVSATGALPSGAAANLTESETLELRDPSGEAVESVTFFTSATGTYIETYTCTLSEDKKSLIWTQGGAAVTEVSLPSGQSQGMAASWGGKANPSDFASIVFYDWDETLLGSAVVSKTATANDLENVLNNFVSTKYSGYTSGMNLPADLANESWIDDKAYPLTYKKGYNFAGWVKITGDMGDMFTAYATLEEFQSEQVKMEQITDGTALMAAYVANEKINTGTNNYSITQTIYNRYGAATGTTGNYSIKVTIERKNATESGVSRIRKPALRITMTPDITGAGPFYSLVYLDNTDVTEAEIVPSKGIRVVQYTVIDTYGVSNWTTAGTRLPNTTQNKNTGGVQGTDGFVKFGTIAFINEQGILQNEYQNESPPRTNAGWNQVNNIAFQDAGLTYQNVPVANAASANKIKPYVLAALKENGNQALTLEQLQYAIDHEGALLRDTTN